MGGLGQLPHLASLDLSHTAVSDVRPLGLLPQLSSLVLTGAKVTDLAPLAQLGRPISVIVSDGTTQAVKTSLTRLRSDATVRTETELRQVSQGPR